ncbi:MAG: hypothetical protein MR868_14260 [Lachnospiraceae bacterium]|nr:hypothetical protein [Lachnospiraceae bacterium]
MNEKITFLKQKQKRLQILGTIFLIALIIVLLIGMKSQLLSAVLAFLFLLIYLFGIRSAKKSYQQAVKTVILEESFRPQFKQITYLPKDGLSPSDLADTGFFPVAHAKNMLIRDTLKGTYQGMPVVLSDLTFDVVSSQPGSTKNTVDFLAGCYFDIQLNKKTGMNCCLWSEDCMPQNRKKDLYPNLICAQLEASGEKPHSYCLYQLPDMPETLFPDSLLKAICRLDEYTPGAIALQITDDHLRIFIRSRFLYTMTVKIQAPLTSQLLTANPFPEIHAILRTADTLIS